MICRRTRPPASARPSRATGATLTYLPPYSPDFNPIAMSFAKLKSLIRARAERTVSTLWNTVGDIIDLFEPQQAMTLHKMDVL